MSQGRRYRVLGLVGRGGFGSVYRAELLGEGGFKRIVALKVLNPDMEGVTEVAGRLRDEARLLGLLRHRAIVQVDGLVLLDDRWTVVMEFIAGADVSRLVRDEPIPARAALEIAGEVAGALHVAYSTRSDSGEPLKLLHRDIKPSNIIVTGAGEVKVVDFGVARADFSGREAQTRSMRYGSLGYMAPERLDLQDGPEADVYALGVVLYEMLTGDSYGKSSTSEAKHRERLRAARERLEALPTPPVAPVIDFVLEMIAFDRSARPTARDVERRCRDLQAMAGGAWLRDWAENAVPPLLEEVLEAEEHDFSESLLMERSGASGPIDSTTMTFDGPIPHSEMPRNAMHTWTGEEDEGPAAPRHEDGRMVSPLSLPPTPGLLEEMLGKEEAEALTRPKAPVPRPAARKTSPAVSPLSLPPTPGLVREALGEDDAPAKGPPPLPPNTRTATPLPPPAGAAGPVSDLTPPPAPGRFASWGVPVAVGGLILLPVGGLALVGVAWTVLMCFGVVGG